MLVTLLYCLKIATFLHPTPYETKDNGKILGFKFSDLITQRILLEGFRQHEKCRDLHHYFFAPIHILS